jgi:hypothetical protein
VLAYRQSAAADRAPGGSSKSSVVLTFDGPVAG